MKKYLIIGIRVLVALILIQTLRYKFTAHPDSVYIFTQLGMEPMGRIDMGVMELLSAILILIPRTAWLGAILTLGIIGGAIFMHLTILRIEVNGDRGILFGMAILTFIMAVIIGWIYRKDIPFIGSKLET